MVTGYDTLSELLLSGLVHLSTGKKGLSDADILDRFLQYLSQTEVPREYINQVRDRGVDAFKKGLPSMGGLSRDAKAAIENARSVTQFALHPDRGFPRAARSSIRAELKNLSRHSDKTIRGIAQALLKKPPEAVLNLGFEAMKPANRAATSGALLLDEKAQKLIGDGLKKAPPSLRKQAGEYLKGVIGTARKITSTEVGVAVTTAAKKGLRLGVGKLIGRAIPGVFGALVVKDFLNDAREGRRIGERNVTTTGVPYRSTDELIRMHDEELQVQDDLAAVHRDYPELVSKFMRGLAPDQQQRRTTPGTVTIGGDPSPPGIDPKQARNDMMRAYYAAGG